LTPRYGLSLPNRGVLFGATSVDELLTLSEQADASGAIDSIWVGDSLFAKPRLESLVLLSAMAARTRRARLGTCCLSTFPLRDPLFLAAQWAALDHVSSGRMVLGACVGGSLPREKAEAEFAPFKVRLADRGPASRRASRSCAGSGPRTESATRAASISFATSRSSRNRSRSPARSGSRPTRSPS